MPWNAASPSLTHRVTMPMFYPELNSYKVPEQTDCPHRMQLLAEAFTMNSTSTALSFLSVFTGFVMKADFVSHTSGFASQRSIQGCRRALDSRAIWIPLLFIALTVIGTTRLAAADKEFPPELVNWAAHKANPLFAGAGEGKWDTKIRERGWILRDGDTWKMWYTGYDGTREGVKHMGYATSKDGLKWTRHADNPVYDKHWIEDMMIVKQGKTYYMFAEGKGDQPFLLTSTDGIQWESQGSLDVRLVSGKPIDKGPYGTPTAWYEKGTWYLFYERRDLGVWLATSKDMQVWRNVQDEPVLTPGQGTHDMDLIAMNQIIKHKGKYYTCYHGTSREPKPNLWTSNIAVSTDLLHWKKYAGNPLLPIGENKSSNILIRDGKRFRMYTMHGQVNVHFPRGR